MTKEVDSFLPEWSMAVGSAALEAAGEHPVGRPLPLSVQSRPEPPEAEGGAGAELGHRQWGRLGHAVLPSRWPLSDVMNSVFAGGLMLVGFRGHARSAGTSQLQSRTAL